MYCCQEKEVLLEDVIGVQDEEGSHTDQPCSLTVRYYPAVSTLMKRVQCKRYQTSIQFDGKENYEENFKDALAWKNKFFAANGESSFTEFKMWGQSAWKHIW